jgi:hypothetical protein
MMMAPGYWNRAPDSKPPVHTASWAGTGMFRMPGFGCVACAVEGVPGPGHCSTLALGAWRFGSYAKKPYQQAHRVMCLALQRWLHRLHGSPTVRAVCLSCWCPDWCLQEQCVWGGWGLALPCSLMLLCGVLTNACLLHQHSVFVAAGHLPVTPFLMIPTENDTCVLVGPGMHWPSAKSSAYTSSLIQ